MPYVQSDLIPRAADTAVLSCPRAFYRDTVGILLLIRGTQQHQHTAMRLTSFTEVRVVGQG